MYKTLKVILLRIQTERIIINLIDFQIWNLVDFPQSYKPVSIEMNILLKEEHDGLKVFQFDSLPIKDKGGSPKRNEVSLKLHCSA